MDYSWIGACVLLLAALAADVRTMRIPNRLTVTALFMGVAIHSASQGVTGLRRSLVGAGIGLGVLAIFYFIRAVGAGDVKLYAALGAWIGPQAVIEAVFYAVMIGGILGVAIAALWRCGLSRLWRYAGWLPEGAAAEESLNGEEERLNGQPSWKGMRFPFMLAACPGAFLVWLT